MLPSILAFSFPPGPAPLSIALSLLLAIVALGVFRAGRRRVVSRTDWGLAAILLGVVTLGATLGARSVLAPVRRAERTGAVVSDRTGIVRAVRGLDASTSDTGPLAAAPGRELEVLTDRARARLVAGDTRAAASSLRAASRLVADASRTEADPAAARALTMSAHELVALAVEAEGGVVPPVRAVDGAVTRARLADARMHHARVMPLVRNLRNAEAGIELLWAVDHLGRALHEAAPGTGAGTAAVLDDARAAALRLTRPELGVPASTGIVLERLAVELDRAARRIAPAGTPAPVVPNRA